MSESRFEQIMQLIKHDQRIKAMKPVEPPKGLAPLDPQGEIPQCVWYKGIVLPIPFAVKLDKVEALKFDARDVFVCGQMKTGTTWICEIVYHLLNGGKDLFNHNIPDIKLRAPCVTDPAFGTSTIESTPPPRLIRAHMSYYAQPASYSEVKPKTIYLMRNPKDTCVSNYYFMKGMPNFNYTGTLDDMVESFIAGNFWGFGPFTESIRSYWENKDKLNILFVFYEDVHKDFDKEVKRIAEFLDLDLSETLLGNIRKATTAQAMRENKTTNYDDLESDGTFKFAKKGGFVREGKVGNWKNHLSEEQSRKIETWVDKELTPLGIQFCYELD